MKISVKIWAENEVFEGLVVIVIIIVAGEQMAKNLGVLKPSTPHICTNMVQVRVEKMHSSSRKSGAFRVHEGL